MSFLKNIKNIINKIKNTVAVLPYDDGEWLLGTFFFTLMTVICIGLISALTFALYCLTPWSFIGLGSFVLIWLIVAIIAYKMGYR